MEEIRRTTTQALDVLDAAFSSIEHSDRSGLSVTERAVLMSRARRIQNRATSLACVLTDEVSQSQASNTGRGHTDHVFDCPR